MSTAARRTIDVLVVAASALFVFWQLHPDLILAETTPAGGDMGAHVWAFAYLRDHLLPDLRLAGWTPDWYAGFPVFQFYMVLPFLAMVALNTGLAGAAALLPAGLALLLAARAAGASMRDRAVLVVIAGAAVVALGVGFWVDFGAGWGFALIVAGVSAALAAGLGGRGSRRRTFAIAAVLVAVFGVALPYGPSFKLVSVAGVVAMPAAAYAFGRLRPPPAPTPVLLSVTTLGFLFDKSFTIYGGNIASTMAGEFAFSISLALALVYLGVLVHGLRTGTHRATAAALLAVVGLCHLIPAFFALGATVVLLVVHLLAEPARDGVEQRRTALVGGGVAGSLAVVLGRARVARPSIPRPGHRRHRPDRGGHGRALVVVALLVLTREGTDGPEPLVERPRLAVGRLGMAGRHRRRRCTARRLVGAALLLAPHLRERHGLGEDRGAPRRHPAVVLVHQRGVDSARPRRPPAVRRPRPGGCRAVGGLPQPGGRGARRHRPRPRPRLRVPATGPAVERPPAALLVPGRVLARRRRHRRDRRGAGPGAGPRPSPAAPVGHGRRGAAGPPAARRVPRRSAPQRPGRGAERGRQLPPQPLDRGARRVLPAGARRARHRRRRPQLRDRLVALELQRVRAEGGLPGVPGDRGRHGRGRRDPGLRALALGVQAPTSTTTARPWR